MAGADRVARLSAFARPKSRTLTVPSGVTLTFAGLRSRWTIPLLVRRLQRLGDLPRDGERLVERERAARDALGQRLALDQLHDQAALPPSGLLEAVDRGDVRDG